MVKRKNREEIRYHLTGPNATIRTPFLHDGTIDYNGLRNSSILSSLPEAAVLSLPLGIVCSHCSPTRKSQT